MKNSFEDSPYLVHAEGEVLARTRYTSIIEEPIVKTDKIETGRTYRQRGGLKFKDKGIRFLSGDIPYENYIEEIIEKDIVNFKWAKIDIPIKIVNYTFREVELKEIRRDIDFLKKTSQLKGIKEINKQLSDEVEILSKNAIYTIDGNILRTQIVIETIEDISKKQIISN